ncbi:MAG: argininosuccinate lyase, partial [Candidatus Omnitrophica bacterium]|nr:argininosuccinate lyase [Candidatus Omnitrophota bacterium]
ESVNTVMAELEIFSGVVDSIQVKKETALKMLEDEFIYATDVAEYLVNKKVSFKDAHRVVGEIVKHCADSMINISDLSITELKKFSDKFDGDVYALLNAEVSVEKKKTPGSTNPSLVKKEIARWKKKISG